MLVERGAAGHSPVRPPAPSAPSLHHARKQHRDTSLCCRIISRGTAARLKGAPPTPPPPPSPQRGRHVRARCDELAHCRYDVVLHMTSAAAHLPSRCARAARACACHLPPAACRLPPAPAGRVTLLRTQCSCRHGRPPPTSLQLQLCTARSTWMHALRRRVWTLWHTSRHVTSRHVMQIAAAQSTVHPVCAQAYAAHPRRLVCSSTPSSR